MNAYTTSNSKNLWTLLTQYLFARLDAGFIAERSSRASMNSRLALHYSR